MNSSCQKSLEPSVFKVKSGDEPPTLLGSRCPKCQRVFFPAREWCAACLEPLCKSIELSREGTLVSFALVERKQDYSIVEPPYVLGEVLLPEGIDIYTTINLESEVSAAGVRVYSTLDEHNMDSLKMGQKVILKPVVIKKEEECEVLAYNFATLGTE